MYEEDIESGPRPSKGLNPVVKQRASGVFFKIFLTSKYSASGCENVVQFYWKRSSEPLG